ncbi:MAG: DNA ligase-associated DEXH box helicase [Planctomycetaceae bacterium]|nr:MAG: DNA ligase-associated DEXH box helicase [Planctomycetaceae bacterium]
MTSAGLYCEAGGFHIDPCRRVATALVTHAHSDHFVRGCHEYVTSASGASVLAHRLPESSRIEAIPYARPRWFREVMVSFHPAGHVLGSAQIRIEYRGEVWVVTGDCQLTPQPTCEPFQPIPCDHLVMEATFGHPQFRWPTLEQVCAQIHSWWQRNQRRGYISRLWAYAFGKAQRVLSLLDPHFGPIFITETVASYTRYYEQQGIHFPPYRICADDGANLTEEASWGLVIASPHSRRGSRWQMRFPTRTALVSGWSLVPEELQRRGVGSGFPLSDHADHSDLKRIAELSQARTLWITHGAYIDALVEEFRAEGRQAYPLHPPAHRSNHHE